MPGEVRLELRLAPLVVALPPPPFDSRISVRFAQKVSFWFVLGFD